MLTDEAFYALAYIKHEGEKTIMYIYYISADTVIFCGKKKHQKLS